MSEKGSALHKEVSTIAPLNHVKMDNSFSTPGSDGVTERDVRSAFLDDILTKEQNSCIEIRDICTGISNDAKEALRSGCTKEFIRSLREQMHTLQAGIESLDDAAGKKTMLEEEFVEKGTTEWLAKRFSSETRRRRLRGHKRRPKQDSDDFELPKKPDESPPISKKSPSFQSSPLPPPINIFPYSSHSPSPNVPSLTLTPSPSSPSLLPTKTPRTTSPPTIMHSPSSAASSPPVLTSSAIPPLVQSKRISSQMNINNIIN